MTGYESKRAAARDKLTVDREQLKQWLEALKDIDALHHSQEPESVDAQKAIADMGQALAQPEQEPVKLPEQSEWKCYLFGNTPQDNQGIVWVPIKGQEPNRFVRWMMKVCFACTWIKEKNT
jgi:hypothetical protein